MLDWHTNSQILSAIFEAKSKTSKDLLCSPLTVQIACFVQKSFENCETVQEKHVHSLIWTVLKGFQIMRQGMGYREYQGAHWHPNVLTTN